MELKSENELERAILCSEVFKIASMFGNPRKGHPEATIGSHIQQIFDFIDKQPWQDYRHNLRILGLLHDLGKYRVVRSENGHVIGKGHSEHSVDIAKRFLSDESLLNLIGIHDKYYHFYKDWLNGKFKKDKFIRIYSPLDLDLLIRFNYADSNNRERNSVMWFEDSCVKEGLRTSKVYCDEPGVLK